MDPATALLIVSVGITAGKFIYHRLTEPQRAGPRSFVEAPRIEEGSPYPLIFGRCRVRAPVIAWVGNVQVWPGSNITGTPDGDVEIYHADMLVLLGIPMGTTNRIHSVFAGDVQLTDFSTIHTGDNVVPIGDLQGGGGFEWDLRRAAATSFNAVEGTGIQGGFVEFLNGNTSQTLVGESSPHDATTIAGERMAAAGLNPAEIPGYRGFLSAFLFGLHQPSGWDSDPSIGWCFGTSPQLPTLSFEASSYPFEQHYPAFVPTMVGDDWNPADVIAAVLCNGFGALGLDPSETLHYPSFRKAGETLLSEGHGYSRCFEAHTPAREIIAEVLRQIDGVLYEDPDDGLWHLRLVRPDYDPNTIPRITTANCERLESFTIRSLTDLPNAVRVMYTDRQAGYVERSAAAQNQANAVGQDGLVNEVQLSMPGVSNSTLASTLASRDLAALSFPARSCRAVVDRSFLDVNPGDAVAIVWPEYKITFAVFRVANVDRGAPSSNVIALDLIEDHFGVYRRKVDHKPTIAPFPTSVTTEVE